MVAAITSTHQLVLGFYTIQKGVSSDNPEHAFILWLIKIAAVTFTVHAVMTDYLLCGVFLFLVYRDIEPHSFSLHIEPLVKVFVYFILFLSFSHNSPDRARGGTYTYQGARESACMLVFSAASRLTYVCTLVDSCPRSNLFVSLAYSLSAP